MEKNVEINYQLIKIIIYIYYALMRLKVIKISYQHGIDSIKCPSWGLAQLINANVGYYSSKQRK